MYARSMQKHKSTAICWACVFCLSEEKLVLGFGNTLCMCRGAADPVKCFSLQEQTRVKHALIWHNFNSTSFCKVCIWQYYDWRQKVFQIQQISFTRRMMSRSKTKYDKIALWEEQTQNPHKSLFIENLFLSSTALTYSNIKKNCNRFHNNDAISQHTCLEMQTVLVQCVSHTEIIWLQKISKTWQD